MSSDQVCTSALCEFQQSRTVPTLLSSFPFLHIICVETQSQLHLIPPIPLHHHTTMYAAPAMWCMLSIIWVMDNLSTAVIELQLDPSVGAAMPTPGIIISCTMQQSLIQAH